MYNADWSENVLLAVNAKSKCIYTCKNTHLQPSAPPSVIHGQWSDLLHQLGLWVTVFHSTVLIHLPSKVTRAHTQWAGLHCGIPSYKSLWSVWSVSLHATAIFLAQLSWYHVRGGMWDHGELRWPMREVCKIQSPIKILIPRCCCLHCLIK